MSKEERLIMSNHSDKEKSDGRKYFEEYKSKHNIRAQEYLSNPKKLQVLYEKANKKARKRKAPLEKVWDKLILLFELVRDWKNGSYKKIPKSSIIMIIIGLIYFVSPVDAIVDTIPILGLIDDVSVVGFILKHIDKDINDYKEWKSSTSK